MSDTSDESREERLQPQDTSKEEAQTRAVEELVNQIIPVIDGEEYESEELEPSSSTSEAWLVGGELILEGYVVAFYDYENNQWYSQETLEPVQPDEWWPLPSPGTGLTGDKEDDGSDDAAAC